MRYRCSARACLPAVLAVACCQAEGQAGRCTSGQSDLQRAGKRAQALADAPGVACPSCRLHTCGSATATEPCPASAGDICDAALPASPLF